MKKKECIKINKYKPDQIHFIYVNLGVEKNVYK